MARKVYYRGECESALGVGEIYTEFDGEVATRQIEKYNGRWYSSRAEYHEGIGPSLYDGLLSDLDMSESELISRDEFETAWKESE